MIYIRENAELLFKNRETFSKNFFCKFYTQKQVNFSIIVKTSQKHNVCFVFLGYKPKKNVNKKTDIFFKTKKLRILVENKSFVFR